MVSNLKKLQKTCGYYKTLRYRLHRKHCGKRMSGNGRRKGNVRPLGAVRQPIQTPFERVGRLPGFGATKVDPNYELTGSAMQVPPPKEEKEKEKEEPKQPKPVIKSGKSDSGSSTKSQPTENLVERKELTDVKNKVKELKAVIAGLEKEIAELKEKLAEKEKFIEELQVEHAKQEEHYKKLYEAEKASHESTKKTLKDTQKEVDELREQMAKLIREQEEKLNQAKIEFEKKLMSTVEEKDKIIADKDMKLNRLKQQMAESLKGNSWERQQQLEELTKELGRIQDEADSLRVKLKQYKHNKTCANCQEMTIKLEKAVNAIKEKDVSIKELRDLCSKFETQLTKQDEILKMFAEKKGYKVPNYPK